MGAERVFLKGLAGLTNWGHFSANPREARRKTEAKQAKEAFWTLPE